MTGKSYPDGCINWPGRVDRDGYGITPASHGERRAPRLFYRLFVGEIPPGMVVRHSCDNPRCINPAHLLTGTPAQNTDDARKRGRLAFGRRPKSAKLDDEAVRAIRAGHMSVRDAEFIFGIKKSAYYRARSGESYRSAS